MSCIFTIYKNSSLYLLSPLVFLIFFSSISSHATGIETYILSDMNSNFSSYQDNPITTVYSSSINSWTKNNLNINLTNHFYNKRVNDLNSQKLYFIEVVKNEVDYQSYERIIINLTFDPGKTNILELKSIVDIMPSDIQPLVVPLTDSYKINLSVINAFNLKTIKSDQKYLSTRNNGIRSDTLKFTLQMPDLVRGIILSVSASAILFGFALFCFVTFSTRRNIS